MKRITSNVWQLHSAHGCNVYAVEAGDKKLAVIDCGLRISERVITEINEIQIENSLREVGYILVTHKHRDHIGGLSSLRKYFPEAKIVAGEADCFFDTDNQSWINDNPVSIVVSGEMGSITELTPNIKGLALPGHTMGSLAFICEKSGVTFTGDAVISHVNTLARPLKFLNADDTLYLESLKTLASLATDIGAPGHGFIVDHSFAERISDLAEQPRQKMNPYEAYRIIKGLIAFIRLRRRKNV
ncbi:MAG TPA: MBL fold metallo-hydrolase [Dehalococcoidia bacterium]|nr:MBL fold metallo-hydrolase [Dehalococcoidia bacterium]